MPSRAVLPCESSDLDWFTDDAEVAAQCATDCFLCPIQEDCYDGAVGRDEVHGVWGGEIFNRKLVG